MTTRRQFLQGIIAGAIGAAAARVGLVDTKAKETAPDTTSRTLLVVDENGDAWKDATDWEVNEALKTCGLGGEIDWSYSLNEDVIVDVMPHVRQFTAENAALIANGSIMLPEPWGIKSEQVRARITELREGAG